MLNVYQNYLINMILCLILIQHFVQQCSTFQQKHII